MGKKVALKRRKKQRKVTGNMKKIPEEAERSPDCKNAKDRCDAWGLSGILGLKIFSVRELRQPTRMVEHIRYII